MHAALSITAVVVTIVLWIFVISTTRENHTLLKKLQLLERENGLLLKALLEIRKRKRLS